MGITYDPNNNVITVTGYSESVPCTFEDLYNADLAGTLQLLAPTTLAPDMSLDRQIKPADSGALRLTLIVTNYSTPKYNITLTGTDQFGNAQQEVIEITGDGSYVTNEYFRTIDTGGIDPDAGAVGTLEITQPRWGVISKQYDKSFGVDCQLTIGTFSTEGWFADDGKQIVFSANTPSQFIYVEAAGHFRLGKVVDETLKLCEKGCDLISARVSGPTLKGDGSVELYSSRFLSTSPYAAVRLVIQYTSWFGTTKFRMWMCIADKTELSINPTGTYSVDVYRLTSQKSTIAITPAVGAGTYDDLFIHSCENAFYIAGSITFSVKNVVLKNNTYVAYASYFEGTFYLINAEADNWTFNWAGGGDGKIYRQYEFDVHCQDKDGNDLSGVSAVGEYISPYGQAFSETTDANGDIPTQILDHGWFESAYGNTEQLKTPLKVTYKKAGYQTVVKYYDLDKKTKDVVVMHKAVGVFLDFGRPVINLKKTDPENKNVMVL